VTVVRTLCEGGCYPRVLHPRQLSPVMNEALDGKAGCLYPALSYRRNVIAIDPRVGIGGQVEQSEVEVVHDVAAFSSVPTM
jgi:hypothetical protein